MKKIARHSLIVIAFSWALRWWHCWKTSRDRAWRRTHLRCTRPSSDSLSSHNTLKRSKFPTIVLYNEIKIQWFSIYICGRAQSKLSFLTFHKWFEEFVAGWIKLSREKCESRIEQAIQLDEIVKITKDLKLSTSAVDTRGFLHQMAAFWQHLDSLAVTSKPVFRCFGLISHVCKLFICLHVEIWQFSGNDEDKIDCFTPYACAGVTKQTMISLRRVNHCLAWYTAGHTLCPSDCLKCSYLIYV